MNEKISRNKIHYNKYEVSFSPQNNRSYNLLNFKTMQFFDLFTDCCISHIHVVEDADQLLRIRKSPNDVSCDDEFAKVACNNHGECFIITDLREWYCNCSKGYMGRHCEKTQMDYTRKFAMRSLRWNLVMEYVINVYILSYLCYTVLVYMCCT